jgi:hypothetical protein
MMLLFAVLVVALVFPAMAQAQVCDMQAALAQQCIPGISNCNVSGTDPRVTVPTVQPTDRPSAANPLNIGDTILYIVQVGNTSITGVPGGATPTGTIRRLNQSLDCRADKNILQLCELVPPVGGDQGAVVSYGGDSTILTDCVDANLIPVGWVSDNPGGGTADNVITFTPVDGALNPTEIEVPGETNENFCFLAYELTLVSPQPTSGDQSDATVFGVENEAGFVSTCKHRRSSHNGCILQQWLDFFR